MLIVNSKDGVPVRLTTERWQHIIARHPELAREEEKVLITLNSPDLIQEGDYGTKLAVKQFGAASLPGKNLVVIYKEISKEDGFILTAYFTNKLNEKRRMLWKR